MPRYVVFDLFDTLVPAADQERDRVVAEMAGMVGVPPAALVEAYHDTWRQRFTGWDVEETIRTLAERLGGRPTPASVARAAAHRRDFAARALAAVHPATLDLLDELRACGARLALVSNATAEIAEAWPHVPLAARFDIAVFSCDVGVAKPDPASYLAAAVGLGAAPAECVYVGDGAGGELAGAEALGMTVFRTVELNDTDPTWPGRSITALAELPALLRDAATDRHGPTAHGIQLYVVQERRPGAPTRPCAAAEPGPAAAPELPTRGSAGGRRECGWRSASPPSPSG